MMLQLYLVCSLGRRLVKEQAQFIPRTALGFVKAMK